MSAQPTPDGIVIQSYLPNLDDQDIEALLDVARACGRQSRLYGKWIASLLEVELQRREDESSETPAEVALPRFSATRWTGAELADALHASYGAMGATTDRPTAHDLLTKLDLCLRGWTAHRLRKLG